MLGKLNPEAVPNFSSVTLTFLVRRSTIFLLTKNIFYMTLNHSCTTSLNNLILIIIDAASSVVEITLIHPLLNLKTRPPTTQTRRHYSEDFHPTPHTVTPLTKCNSVVLSAVSTPCGHRSRITYRCSLIHSTK